MQGTIGQQAKMCFPEWVLKKQPHIINGFLKHQSNCSIPSLLFQAGLTAVTKMQGQGWFFQGYAFLQSILPWEEWWDCNMWSWRETWHFCHDLAFQWMTICLRRCTLLTVISVNSKWAHCLVSYCDKSTYWWSMWVFIVSWTLASEIPCIAALCGSD